MRGHMMVLLALFCGLTQAADPTSPMGNVESVCTYVAEGLSNFRDKFARYQPNCPLYRGIGEEALKPFMQEDNNCYGTISKALCQMQFQEYESSPHCKNTLDFFFNLVSTCGKGQSMSSTYFTCDSFDPASKLIESPYDFCKNSFLRVDKGESADEAAASYDVKSFARSQASDCKRAVENYNACMLIGVNILGYKPHYCTGGGFPSYCNKYPLVIRDPTFKIICQNIVIPYIMEMNRQSDGMRESDYCHDIYQKYLFFLTARKGDFLNKAKAARDSLTSVQQAMDMVNSFKKSVVELAQNSIDLDRESTELLNNLRQLAESKMAIDSTMKSQYQQLAAALSSAENALSSLQKPEITSNMDENMDMFATVTPTVEAVVGPQLKALASVRELQHLLDSGGHVAYASSYGFFPLQSVSIEVTRQRLKVMNEKIEPFTSDYGEQLEQIPTIETSSEEQIRSDGKTNSELADIFASQIAFLVKMQRFGAVSGNPVVAAATAATESAATAAAAASA